eukprot:TRINITY_DN3900_c0_g1_i1.p1 TRINITY_DN3900_c0_g1~~TRINITY_DN3900_c0_g1_i1.p1  ORF type:complete len:384 (+),score=112.78 TRINITY_DN3900_c0_g1_i1:95-1246(+)
MVDMTPFEVPSFALDAASKQRRRELVSSGSPLVQMLVGNAIGDSFGFGIEMEDAFWIRKNVSFDSWATKPCLPDWWTAPRGIYSDDCEMTIGVINGLMEHGLAIDADKLVDAWKAEYDLAMKRPPPLEPGYIRHGHGSIRFAWAGEKTLQEVRESQKDKVDPGNAPPMRSLGLAFVSEGDRERLCKENADATHPHPKARASSFLLAFGANFLIMQRGQQQEVLKAASAALLAGELREALTEEHLQKLDALPDYHEFGERFCDMPENVHELLCGLQPCPYQEGMHGIWSDAMRTAGVVLYILKWQRGPLDALKASVDVGGDVDSVAALVLGVIGGTSGLRFGEEGGLPWFLLEEVEGIEYLSARACKFETWLQAQALPVPAWPQ